MGLCPRAGAPSYDEPGPSGRLVELARGGIQDGKALWAAECQGPAVAGPQGGELAGRGLRPEDHVWHAAGSVHQAQAPRCGGLRKIRVEDCQARGCGRPGQLGQRQGRKSGLAQQQLVGPTGSNLQHEGVLVPGRASLIPHRHAPDCDVRAAPAPAGAAGLAGCWQGE